MKILLDNGHGIDTPGKRSPDGVLREYAWNRLIAGRVVSALTDLGHDAALLVPEQEDIPLPERCRRVNERCRLLGRDNVILISIHANAAGLHRRGSKAVERYTNMEIRDDFALRNIAFRQKAYKVDKDLNVLE